MRKVTTRDLRSACGIPDYFLMGEIMFSAYRVQEPNSEIPNRRCRIRMIDSPVKTTRLSEPNQVAKVEG